MPEAQASKLVRSDSVGVDSITVHWPDSLNDFGRPMLWMASWLIGGAGEEGDWFFSGRIADANSGSDEGVGPHTVPAEATGIRVRRWPDEEFSPEYADVIPLRSDTIDIETLAFDRRQIHSRLRLEPRAADESPA
jgi:hypothetical protein